MLMSVIIICIFFTKLCDVIKRSCYRFFYFPEHILSFPLYSVMWKTVCFVISAKDIKCLFWYKLGGVRLAGRTEGGCLGKRGMSVYEECLSEQVVYTWQTLIIIIIIIIIICKGQSKAVRVSICCDKRRALIKTHPLQQITVLHRELEESAVVTILYVHLVGELKYKYIKNTSNSNNEGGIICKTCCNCMHKPTSSVSVYSIVQACHSTSTVCFHPWPFFLCHQHNSSPQC